MPVLRARSTIYGITAGAWYLPGSLLEDALDPLGERILERLLVDHVAGVAQPVFHVIRIPGEGLGLDS